MPYMNSPNVVTIEHRRRRVSRVMALRRQLHDAEPSRARTRGRIWLNGSQLGETRATLAHLSESYD